MKTNNSKTTVQDEMKWSHKEKLIIIDVIENTHDVKTFRFKREKDKRFPVFKAGQFLSFQIKGDDKLLRSYSISGSCENTSTLQVSIKHIKDGVGSGWFHSLKVNDVVIAYPPGGHFSDNEIENDLHRIYVGGGIGITPLISMIKTNIDRASKAPMFLFYGMNSVNDLVFHKELDAIASSYSNLKYFPILSPGSAEWSGVETQDTLVMII